MHEIVVEPRLSYSLKQAVTEAIKTGDYTSLCDDIRDCFTEEQVEEMEDLLDSGDIGEAVDEIVNEWNGEDLDELFEAIGSYFAASNIEIQFLQDEDFDAEDAVDAEEPDYDDFEDEDEDEDLDDDEEVEGDPDEEFVDPDEDM